MYRSRTIAIVCLAFSFIFTSASYGQLTKITFPAGTPEDLALNAISSESDGQKKIAMYQDFIQKFSSNPDAVAYGDWQLAQLYQGGGDLQKALESGDKAIAAQPHDLDILVTQATIAQQAKNSDKVIESAVAGGTLYNSLGKQPKPEGMADADFANRITQEKDSAKSSYEFLEVTAFNTIGAEPDSKKRMSYIEHFTPAFPNSQFAGPVSSYAMMSLSELKDMPRLVAYANQVLAANPKDVPALLLLANAYSEDAQPDSPAKAAAYAQKVIDIANPDAPDANRSRKLSGGAAHSTLGYALLKQDKTAAAVPQFKAAATLLKGQDDQQYAIALYRLGYASAKINKVADAKAALTEAASISGPMQQPAKDLLAKVNAARPGVKASK
jgi:tetratricopeptide (TPR) repeat protein